MNIASILSARTGSIHVIGADETVATAAATLAEKRIGAMPVMDGDRLVGMFSERDVLYRLASEGAALLSMKVGDVMTREVITVTPDTAIITCLSLMTRRRIRHLPVCVDGKLTGFVSIGDLVKHRMDMIEAEAVALRDYIQNA